MKTVYYEKPAKVAEVPRDGHVVIEASAGTGKTFTLEHLVVDLIIDAHVDVAEIVVVTFTDAATRELRDRIRRLLRRLCEETSDTKPPKGADAAGRFWVIDDAARGRLREALFRFDGATIATIHGFCQRVLTEHAFSGGRLFEQAHVDGKAAFEGAFREVIREVLARDDEVSTILEDWIQEDGELTELFRLLHDCHRTRCERTPRWDPEGLVEALDGIPPIGDLQAAAKTRLGKAGTQIGKFLGYLDEEVLALQRAGAEATDLVDAFLGWGGKPRTIQGDKRPVLGHLDGYLGPHRDAEPLFERFLDAIDAVEGRAVGPDVRLVDAILPEVQDRLEDRKRALGQLDFDDMLRGVHEALGAGPEARAAGVGDALVQVLRRRWRYALVDEFQDTDTVQWEIFDRLFVDGASGTRLFVIGDPKQAIYGFRGADVHAYLAAREKLVGRAGAGRIGLDRNFRSSAAMIDEVNRILETGFFTGEITYDEPVVCGRDRRWKDRGSDDAPVHLVHLYGEGRDLGAPQVRRGLDRFIAEEIRRLVDPERGLEVEDDESGERRPLRHEEIYVLTWTGREGRAVGEALRRHGVPHAFYKQDGLYQTDEADDVHRLLDAIDRPEDRSARLKAWLTPFFEVPLEDLDRWRDVSEHHPLVAQLLAWKALADQHRWATLFDDVLRGSGLVRRLVFGQESERALTNYLHLFEALLEEAHARPTTLSDLTRELKARIDQRSEVGADGNVQRLETERSAVQILTMHKAKGLQAKVVFVAGGFTRSNRRAPTAAYHDGDGRRVLHVGTAPPGIAGRIATEAQHEDERLLYVALTRAEVRMYLPYFGDALPGANAEGRTWGWPKMNGCYAHLQDRLGALVDAGEAGFALRPTPCAVRLPPVADDATLAGWSPSPDHLAPPESRGPEAGALRERHRGVILTSYTRMTRDETWRPPSADFLDERGDEAAGEGAADANAPGLPGGREAGIFLHEILEETAPASVRGVDATRFAADPAVRAMAAAAARRSGLDERHLDEALALVHRALTAAVATRDAATGAGLAMPGGLASGERHVAEMAFAFPIPEHGHPALADAGATAGALPYAVHRGYVQGLVDLVFEHDGRIFLLDWKSDRLPSFDDDALDAHVQANYRLQAQVYTMAVLRLLDVTGEADYEARFGGILYAFLRGMDDGKGVWLSRPAFDEARRWEAALRERDAWGGPVIAAREAGHG